MAPVARRGWSLAIRRNRRDCIRWSYGHPSPVPRHRTRLIRRTHLNYHLHAAMPPVDRLATLEPMPRRRAVAPQEVGVTETIYYRLQRGREAVLVIEVPDVGRQDHHCA